ncbi:hypothetical protein [Mesorhizobium sp. CA4]|uniref:hypothetical protein n=1 Tax=Mesorhizobium sp. CA4 TaxID=588499 RepID=UPI001CD161DF|nr:hypothetical protein [Mesorhizobium sp. CA4]MBZ9820297.1 hypothetical protein [Mesorhizobium sp. CA4]
MAFKQRISGWYQGKYVPPQNDHSSGIIILMGSYERHWTARLAQVLADFWLAHWQWTIGTTLAIIAIYVGIAYR